MFGFKFYIYVTLLVLAAGWIAKREYDVYSRGFDSCVTQVNKGTEKFENEANKIIQQPSTVHDAVDSLRSRQKGGR
jgi:hypothetical protein